MPGSRPADHVILVSIDGLRPHIYRDDRWPTPILHEFTRRGAMALAVRSVFPALTYPAHTTLVTGMLPARHGIVSNEPFEPAGATGRWIWDASEIRAPALWDRVRGAGGTVAAISWPVTVGAAIDWNVPDVWDPAHPGSIAPIRAATTPPGLLQELEREATGRLSDETFSLDSLVREDVVGAMAAYLFERYRPTLTLMHAIGLDHVRHRLGRDNPRAREAVAAADRAIGRLVETVERVGLRDRTAFVVTGDHGSVDVHTALLPNVWLRDAGVQPATASANGWRAVFQASGGSAFLHVEDASDGTAVARTLETIERLPKGIRALFRVVERAELDCLGADPGAPIALAAMPGVVFSEDREGTSIQAAHGAGHGYLPDAPDMLTGFVAAGSGVRPGAVVPLMPLEHVASFIGALLGLTMNDTDGVLFPGLLESRHELAPARRP